MRDIIVINELSEFRKHEQEIVDRLNSDGLVAQQFVFSPLQALRDVNVQIGEKALAQWAKIVPSLADPAHEIGLVQYNKLKAIKGANGMKVTIRGLLPPPDFDVEQEDNAELRTLRGSSTVRRED